jgi:hypothetical protein
VVWKESLDTDPPSPFLQAEIDQDAVSRVKQRCKTRNVTFEQRSV